jgi:hypothetical protein
MRGFGRRGCGSGRPLNVMPRLQLSDEAVIACSSIEPIAERKPARLWQLLDPPPAHIGEVPGRGGEGVVVGQDDQFPLGGHRAEQKVHTGQWSVGAGENQAMLTCLDRLPGAFGQGDVGIQLGEHGRHPFVVGGVAGGPAKLRALGLAGSDPWSDRRFAGDAGVMLSRDGNRCPLGRS